MTLKDIAFMAGVSTATVSNVLNGNTSKVSDETRVKIEKIIRDVDYKPNAMARSLAKNESRILGLVVPYVGPSENFLMNPYYAQMIAALEQYVREKDYYLMLRCVPSCEQVIPLLSSWRVDGAFFLGVVDKDVKNICEALHSPVVFLDTYSDAEDIVNVGLDDFRGGYLSAKYLIGKGHKKIAFVAPDYKESRVIGERYGGFLKACQEADIPFSEKDYFLTDTAYEKAISVGQDVIASDQKFTAIAAMSDIVALGIMDGVRQYGYSVPGDISIIGFDNLPAGKYVYPKLTTVSQDSEAKALEAVNRMFAILDGKDDFERNIHIPVKLVERQSVADLG